MESCLKYIPGRTVGDLSVVDHLGYAYQRDVKPFYYDEDYFDNYVDWKGTDVANKLNKGRVDITTKHANLGVLDIGVGSGEFMESMPEGFEVLGYDINEKAINYLVSKGKYANPYEGDIPQIDVVTCWDSLEHMPNPDAFLKTLRIGMVLCVSIPIFKRLDQITESKHYKPNEHLFYFTELGFHMYMKSQGFDFVERSTMEMEAGREDILTVVYRKRGEADQ